MPWWSLYIFFLILSLKKLQTTRRVSTTVCFFGFPRFRLINSKSYRKRHLYTTQIFVSGYRKWNRGNPKRHTVVYLPDKRRKKILKQSTELQQLTKLRRWGRKSGQDLFIFKLLWERTREIRGWAPTRLTLGRNYRKVIFFFYIGISSLSVTELYLLTIYKDRRFYNL